MTYLVDAPDSECGKDPEFINGTDLKFEDISTEIYRQYTFKDGQTVSIHNPLKLNVGQSGHRVFDAQGMSHYVPFGWFLLSWQSKAGKPNFVK